MMCFANSSWLSLNLPDAFLHEDIQAYCIVQQSFTDVGRKKKKMLKQVLSRGQPCKLKYSFDAPVKRLIILAPFKHC